MTDATTDHRDQDQQRRIKLNEWRESGCAYPALSQDGLSRVRECHAHGPDENKTWSVTGRIMLKRIMGKASFMTIQDGTGQLQLYMRKQDLPDGVYDQIKHWDLGDLIVAKGHLFHTMKGELTVHVTSTTLLAKSLHPLPEKFHGLGDIETCYRQRYLDLMVNPQTRERFMKRSKIIESLRQFLIENDFLEVETPMMHALAGGATAKPFVTHHNTLDMELFMRVAPELHLKRLVVGGLDRVFEINRNFRNEGISTKHNPEFTMVEFYQAYATYHDLLLLTEKLLKHVVAESCQSTKVHYQGQDIDFGKPFAKMSMKDAVLHYFPELTENIDNLQNLQKWLAEKGWQQPSSVGLCWLEIFEQGIEHQLMQPTFITEFPVECSPLARRSDDNPAVTDRFELFVAGFELANAFSELNDPEDQAQRFEAQMAAKADGDDEAMPFDQDYVTALEYGLPPTAGEGIGIDRLVMLLTDASSIRDVILFPLLRRLGT